MWTELKIDNVNGSNDETEKREAFVRVLARAVGADLEGNIEDVSKKQLNCRLDRNALTMGYKYLKISNGLNKLRLCSYGTNLVSSLMQLFYP